MQLSELRNLKKMKDGVRIVNAARGGVIDEQALINALQSNKVSFDGSGCFCWRTKTFQRTFK